jgi:hypothetical protein
MRLAAGLRAVVSMCCKFVAAFGSAYPKLILARGWRTAPTGVAAIAGNEDLDLTDRVSIRGLSIRGERPHPAGTARRWWQASEVSERRRSFHRLGKAFRDHKERVTFEADLHLIHALCQTAAVAAPCR